MKKDGIPQAMVLFKSRSATAGAMDASKSKAPKQSIVAPCFVEKFRDLWMCAANIPNRNSRMIHSPVRMDKAVREMEMHAICAIQDLKNKPAENIK